jgi:hypothetical protein
MGRGRLILFAVLIVAAPAPPASAAGQVMDWSSPLQLDPGSPSQFGDGSGIDCAGDQLCVATSGEGKILVSTDPTGGAEAWEEVAIEEAVATDITAVSCPSASFCAAVDDAGRLFSSAEPDGGASAWTAAAIDPGHELVDVSCPSTSFCAAADDAGNALVSDDPGAGAAAWESVEVLSSAKPIAISCAGASLCALVYEGANRYWEPPGLLISTDPLAGADSWVDSGLDLGETGTPFGISCPSADFCGLAYGDGILVSDDPAGGSSSWHLTHSISEELSPGLGDLKYADGLGIDCPSPDFCVAQLDFPATQSFALHKPKLLISSQPTAAASWSVQTMNQEWAFGRAGMVCTGPTFCATIAGDGSVSTSTEPAEGSEAWDVALTGRDAPSLTSVACPARTFCAATGTMGRLYTSTDPLDPGSWTPTRLGEYVKSVTCSSPTWCAVGAAGPTVLYSTDPGGGASAWNALARPTGRHLVCPEPGFCAALADDDEVLASDDPLGGAGSWVKTDMQLPDGRLGPGFLAALSCPSAGLCVTGGSGGMVYSSAEPTAGPSSWVPAFVGEDNSHTGSGGASSAVAGIDCPQTSFCAATTAGTVATTTMPLGGKSAWTVSHVPDAYFLGPISCAADASLCVSIDQNGNAVTSSSPQSEVLDWGVFEPIYEGEGLRDVSCAVDGSLCGVISRDGEVIVGTRRPDEPGNEGPEGEEGSAGEGRGSPGAEGSASASPGRPPPPPAPQFCRKPRPHKTKRHLAIGRRHKVSNVGRRSKTRCARPR